MAFTLLEIAPSKTEVRMLVVRPGMPTFHQIAARTTAPQGLGA